MKKIKWENIIFLALIIISIIAIVKHGISIFTPAEIVTYLSWSIVARYITKDLRLNK